MYMDKHEPVKWKKGHNLAELSLAITLNYEIRLIQCNIKVEFYFPCFVVVEFLYNMEVLDSCLNGNVIKFQQTTFVPNYKRRKKSCLLLLVLC